MRRIRGRLARLRGESTKSRLHRISKIPGDYSLPQTTSLPASTSQSLSVHVHARSKTAPHVDSHPIANSESRNSLSNGMGNYAKQERIPSADAAVSLTSASAGDRNRSRAARGGRSAFSEPSWCKELLRRWQYIGILRMAVLTRNAD